MAGLFIWQNDFLIRENSERKGLMDNSYIPSTEEYLLAKTSPNKVSASALLNPLSFVSWEFLFLTAHSDQKNRTKIKYVIRLAIIYAISLLLKCWQFRFKLKKLFF